MKSAGGEKKNGSAGKKTKKKNTASVKKNEPRMVGDTKNW
ncbi:hypothetical protein PF005_g25327 [Phytophthora fragariae]|uniref:Uncharacterized protein n=1 Tax=Phytophthora fragariae TaxID=53985 RepID=A0A6A3I442_9STRA|nr:hypothetical protein PF009_g24465 [Phytophthora fragariae]KAE8977689.1 hypothetical protein PF011_g23553 [Phytophthora fragariae]KAE9075702.1 hypothetical protein PF010_g24201 [Phytophthora fragariae]KAE9076958.1 hypothetical protein PF007_g24430 [Phytophthora fragariae]KAE9080953.1 hypothetical protein PF006_g27213 [Phytophthora fragariae]